MDQQACEALITHVLTEMGPYLALCMGIIVLAMSMLCWPRRPTVTLVVTRDEDGQIANVETVMRWAARRALHREIAADIARRQKKEDA